MYPGLSDADCQVAGFHYRQLVDEGQRQQVSTGLRSASGVNRLVSNPVRQHVGAFLVHAGRRLQGMQTVTGESYVSERPGGIGAIA